MNTNGIMEDIRTLLKEGMRRPAFIKPKVS